MLLLYVHLVAVCTRRLGVLKERVFVFLDVDSTRLFFDIDDRLPITFPLFLMRQDGQLWLYKNSTLQLRSNCAIYLLYIDGLALVGSHAFQIEIH